MKFSATEAMCQAMGCWSYALVHEPEPVEMANVRWLSSYRHPRNRVGEVAGRLVDVFGELRLLVPVGDGSVIGCAEVSRG
ncbi:hypothetical protein ACH40E_22415 [Streptomyces acidicola]|uniref:hypothetical protein n=1 Tax=Streptomyces acidicola TaxID=2596892 RepID=UPI00378E7C06